MDVPLAIHISENNLDIILSLVISIFDMKRIVKSIPYWGNILGWWKSRFYTFRSIFKIWILCHWFFFQILQLPLKIPAIYLAHLILSKQEKLSKFIFINIVRVMNHQVFKKFVNIKNYLWTVFKPVWQRPNHEILSCKRLQHGNFTMSSLIDGNPSHGNTA